MIHEIQKAIVPAGISAGTATVSFFSKTLIYVQWCAGAVAIVSGLVAIAWVIYQWQLKKRNQ